MYRLREATDCFDKFFNKICTALFLAGVCTLVACSSDNKPLKVKNVVEDPVSIQVDGIDKTEVLDNVNAYLESLPLISKKRARLYDREIKENITKAVHTFGYYHPQIEITYPKIKNKDDKKLLAKIDLGKPLFIRKANVYVVGEGAYYKSFSEIVKKSGIGSYHLLDHGNYKQLKDDLLNRAIELGFFDAKFLIARILVYKEQNVADIELMLDTGNRYKFGQMVTDADTKVLLKPSESLVNFHEDQNFSSKVITNFSNSLSQTNYYRSVDVHPLVEERKDGKVPVKVELTRKSKNQFRVGLGYSTDEEVRGILAWDKPLVSSKGHSFSSYFRVSKVKQDAQAVYKIPHKNPISDYYFIRAAQTHTDFNDTLSDLSHLSLHYVDSMTSTWRKDYYLALEYEDFTQGSEKGRTTNLMPGFKISKRTTTGGFDPRAGYSVSFDNKVSFAPVSDLTFWQTEFVFSGIYAPTTDSRILYKLYQGAVIGSDSMKAPPSLRYFAGGDKSLRGFSYKSQSPRIDGNLRGGRFLTATTIEYNFPLGISDSRGAIFFDSAICTDNYREDHSVLYGPGIGYRYLSKYGVFKADIAYGIDNKREQSQFKLHLSFGPEF